MGNILITGANRGIGLEFCKQYLSKENTVYACCRDISHSEELKILKNKYSDLLTVVPLEMESEESICELKVHLKNKLIDILINNAGVYSINNQDSHVENRTWQRFFQINSIGPYLIIQTLLENFQLSSQKKIINISSNMGSINLNYDGANIPYRASKAALNAITKSLAITHAHNKMIFIAMHPGWVRTDMGGPNGVLSSEESVAAMIIHIDQLVSADSGKYYAYDGSELPW